jgi:hypothetical protein
MAKLRASCQRDKRCLHPGEMVVTMTHRVILNKELARERSIAVERYRRSTIQFLIAEGAYRRRGGGTVSRQ